MGVIYALVQSCGGYPESIFVPVCLGPVFCRLVTSPVISTVVLLTIMQSAV